MKVALYGHLTKTPPGQTPDNPESALLVGLRAAGHKVVAQNPAYFDEHQLDRGVDLVILKGERGGSGLAARYFRGQGTPVGVLDLSVLRFLRGDDWWAVCPYRAGHIPDGDASPTRWNGLPRSIRRPRAVLPRGTTS